jgi:hypothetical protein
MNKEEKTKENTYKLKNHEFKKRKKEKRIEHKHKLV